jgi:hypothetical protein
MSRPFQGGWINSPESVVATMATMPRPVFRSVAAGILGSGEGKTVLLYKAVKEVHGEYVYDPNQEIGCCVGRGYAGGVDVLACVEIAVKKQPEVFKPTSHEAIYALSREIGNYLGPVGQDGSVGAWAAKAVTTIGTISREVIGPYSDRRAGEWGHRGVPADVKAKIKNPIRTASLVKSYSEARDAIVNGYPVVPCSDQGFTMKRDDKGFCRPEGTWNHCMLFSGVRHDRPGLCCVNSWGRDVPSGPTDLDQPLNSFWVDADVADRMLRQGDSFALSDFDGYPGKEVPKRWSYADYI